MFNKFNSFIGFILLLMIITACSASDEALEDPELFYEEHSLELLVPTAPGGGSDIMARFMAPYLSEYISGEPTVQVVNVEGGGTLNGANEFAQTREANGEYTLWSSISTTTAYLLDDPAVEFDYQDFTPVLGYPDGGVVYISPDTGVTEPGDLLKTDVEWYYGGTSPVGLPLTTLLSFEVLGLEVSSLFGYESSGPARVAFEQGETNIDFQTTSAYFSNVESLVEEGSAIPLYAIGIIEDGELVRDPLFPELPTVKEVYEEIYGEEPSGPEWDAFLTFVGAAFTVQKVLFVHDDIPEAALTALNNGVEKMIADPDFQSEGEEIFGYEPFIGEELQTMMESILDIDEDVQEWVINFLEEEHDANIR